MKNENKKAIIVCIVFIIVAIFSYQIEGKTYLSDTIYYEYDTPDYEYGEPIGFTMTFYRRVNISQLRIDEGHIIGQSNIDGEIYNIRGWKTDINGYAFGSDIPSECYYTFHCYDENRNPIFFTFSDDFEELHIQFCNPNYEIVGKLKRDGL